MSQTSKVTASVICVTMSAVALLAAGIALAVYMLFPDGSTMELSVVVWTSAIAVVSGVVGVWLHRIRRVISVSATVGLSIVGPALIVGAVGNLTAAAEGGFNNIGASLLLIVGAILVIPCLALAIMLAVLYRREQGHAPA